MFDFNRLHVYDRALSFLNFASRLASGLPRGGFGLADHLRRAALSIQLNVAEGVGRPGGNERAAFLGIARGSAMECAAVLDAIEALGLVNAAKVQEGRLLLVEVVRMLTVMGRFKGKGQGASASARASARSKRKGKGERGKEQGQGVRPRFTREREADPFALRLLVICGKLPDFDPAGMAGRRTTRFGGAPCRP